MKGCVSLCVASGERAPTSCHLTTPAIVKQEKSIENTMLGAMLISMEPTDWAKEKEPVLGAEECLVCMVSSLELLD